MNTISFEKSFCSIPEHFVSGGVAVSIIIPAVIISIIISIIIAPPGTV